MLIALSVIACGDATSPKGRGRRLQQSLGSPFGGAVEQSETERALPFLVVQAELVLRPGEQPVDIGPVHVEDEPADDDGQNQ